MYKRQIRKTAVRRSVDAVTVGTTVLGVKRVMARGEIVITCKGIAPPITMGIKIFELP